MCFPEQTTLNLATLGGKMGRSSLHKLRMQFTIDLHPSKSGDVQAGVVEQLNNMLLRYNEDCEGVIVSYSNEKILSQHAQVHPYFPYLRVKVLCTVVVFQPLPDARLTGIVNKIGSDYIGLVVLGFINVSIPAKNIKKEMKPRFGEMSWVSSKNEQHRIAVGTRVWFRVKEVLRSGEFMSLIGSLDTSDTGAVGFTAVEKEEEEEEKKRKKKRKKEGEEEAGNGKEKKSSSAKKKKG